MLHILKNMVHAGYWLNFQVKGRAGLDKAELDTLLSKAAKHEAPTEGMAVAGTHRACTLKKM